MRSQPARALHPTVAAVTARIVERSATERAAHLAKIEHAERKGPHRSKLSCGNLAHGFAACHVQEKRALAARERPNIGIVTAYNDMLSAHQSFETYPSAIKRAAWEAGGIAQVAGGVPAMCDGVTQGQPGMELSLFSRDVLALSTAVALSHDMFDPDVETVAGPGLEQYTREPFLDNGAVAWRAGPTESADRDVFRRAAEPFDATGGIKVLDGNLGRAIIKVSAVKPQHRVVEAPARVFADQEGVIEAFRLGELDRDVVVVVMHQGPRANGMPELHRLTPPLGVLQDRGFKVALVTDGRMSGASGKVPAAIQVTPEAQLDGSIAKVRDGDRVVLDAETGRLDVLVPGDVLRARSPHPPRSRRCRP